MQAQTRELLAGPATQPAARRGPTSALIEGGEEALGRERRPFRLGLSHEQRQVVDVLWPLSGRDLYDLLVIEGGWGVDRYKQWLVEALAQELLVGAVTVAATP